MSRPKAHGDKEPNADDGNNGAPDTNGHDESLHEMVSASAGHPDVTARAAADHPVREEAFTPPYAQQGELLTTSFGVPVSDTDNSLRAGRRGPTLLEDVHLRDKIMHFDHERIPERVVHARGNGAHGLFQPYASLADLTCAAFLADPEVLTPVFVRFSTVLGSRGAAETTREVRGFATKFYTSAGNFDLVGNNIPVFFIQDGIKFPDLVHAAKPEPHREIPQSGTAHDTFWDFVSLLPESTHMLLWSMSDRTLPRSYRMMEGFGVHTFRLVNAQGRSTLVKFHWKPLLGAHSLLWEEAQLLAGVDPDFLRRDLYDAIDDGVFPEWELGIQIFPDTKDQTFAGIDLLDSTKLVPEELAPVQPIGKITLNRNPTDFFAESEQVAFCTSHLVAGIEPTDDPLLHARMFSYFDTQITRLGGPNFQALPINRPVAPVNSLQQDGFGQTAVLAGRVRYSPNSLGGGCPVTAGLSRGGYEELARMVHGTKTRDREAPQPDYFSQATMFWRSMTPIEQDHIVGAFAFELGKVEVHHVRERMVRNLAEVDLDLTERVAAALGMAAPPAEFGGPARTATQSRALSQISDAPYPVDGRVVAIIISEGVDARGLTTLVAGLRSLNLRPHTVSSRLGSLAGDDGSPVPVTKTLLTVRSVEFDAIILAGGDGTADLLAEPLAAAMVQEAFRHAKPIAAWGNGADALTRAGITATDPGILVGDTADDDLLRRIVDMLSHHRVWERHGGVPVQHAKGGRTTKKVR